MVLAVVRQPARATTAVALVFLAMIGTLLGDSTADALPQPRVADLCKPASPTIAACAGEITTDANGSPMVTAHGVTPADLRSAYRVPSISRGPTGVVAIIDAYGFPGAAATLATYRRFFNLGSCKAERNCLTVLDQRGGHHLPPMNLAWDMEQAIDLEAVAAICPACRILLIEADDASVANLGAAAALAAKMSGVSATSNSYTFGDLSDSAYGKYYKSSRVAVVAATGDFGYAGSAFPSSSRYVVAVGGTRLTRDDSARGWSESAWFGSGSGCTSKNSPPLGQSVLTTKCWGRASADVAADGDPLTGLDVYLPVEGWTQSGGTSLATPIIAAMFALVDYRGTHGLGRYANDVLYRSSPRYFNDVTAGTTGICSVLCTASAGWDGPTGLGSPNGLGPFEAKHTTTRRP